MLKQPPSIIRVIIACALLLLVVHTLGRFIYTPMLPWLVKDGLLNLKQGSDIAAWNYLGYLIGALTAMRWCSLAHIQRLLPWAILVSVSTTLLQTQAESVEFLTLLRLINGIANGIVFVQAPSLVLEWLVYHGRSHLSGLVYLGVGFGLLLSSVLVAIPSEYLVGADRWWPAALCALPLAWWGYRQIAQIDTTEFPIIPSSKNDHTPSNTALFDRASTPLFLSYAGAGLGYILPMTYLPMLASLELPEGSFLINGSWLLVALATLPAPWIWNKVGSKLGDAKALQLNYLIQFSGVIAMLAFPGEVGIILCALLVGTTFLGTVLLTQRLARTLHPHQGPRLSAALVALYSVTQLAGPWLTSQWLAHGGTLLLAFSLGAGALLWGLITSLMLPKPTHH